MRTAEETGTLLVDVRSPGEFRAGHAPGAVNIPLETVERQAALLRQSSDILLICKGGTRATIAQQRLATLGIRAAVLPGGMDAWAREGHTIVSQAGTRWSLERQVRLIAGVLVLAGTIAAWRFGTGWLLLTGFVGAGLTFAGASDICMMGSLLSLMPWNRPR